MNLLVGLAVDDIKAVQEQAALKRMGMLVRASLLLFSLVAEIRYYTAKDFETEMFNFSSFLIEIPMIIFSQDYGCK